MALPQSILDLITTRPKGRTFNPATEHPEVKEHKDLWRLYLDLYELDGEKLAGMIDSHGADEDPAKLALRQKLAVVFNYVPTIVRMIVNYIFSEEPQVTIEDERLKSFVADCSGTGTSINAYIKNEALPMALVFGFVDVLIQNPASNGGVFLTAADEQSQNLTPRTFTVTPLQRINWSARGDHEYNWFRFRDRDSDDADPFSEDPRGGESFVTISGAVDDAEGIPLVDERGNSVGFWIRSWQGRTGASDPPMELPAAVEGEDNVATPPGVAAPGGGTGGGPSVVGQWNHDGDFIPTSRVPVETLYYSRSNDPERRHFGLSKVAMIAVLTRKIIQILSWTDEDVLANLALYVFPGPEPVDAQGVAKPINISPFGIVWLNGDAKIEPSMLQGSVDHVNVKLKIVDLYTREILRLAYLIGASAEAEQITSGVQGVVARNELFQELSDLAGSLDSFAIGILWKAAIWATGEDMTREEFVDRFKPKVVFYKGPYALEPLAAAIKNSQELVKVFERISPTMVKSVLSTLASTVLYQEDDDRDKVLKEIEGGVDKVLQEQREAAEALTAGVEAAAVDPDAPALPAEGGDE